MTAIFSLCGGSSQGAISEIICEQCPQEYRQFKDLPKLCGEQYHKATIEICTKCWNQQAGGGQE